MNYLNMNVLAMAQSVMGKQEYMLRKFKDNYVDDYGYVHDEFYDPVNKSATIVPLENTQYKDHNLDFSKRYIQIFSTEEIDAITRENNSDEIIFDGYVYHVVPNNDWMKVAGWCTVLAVRVSKYVRA